MFNIGPMELLILGFVALIVIGPEKLPGHARDAARLLRNLREMATGARSQLRDELGPELSGLNLEALRELRALNPRSALMNALFDESEPLKGIFDSEADRVGTSTTPPPPSAPPLAHPLAPGESAPFDQDAT
jgi:sec-independent protein translocase protein TatB